MDTAHAERSPRPVLPFFVKQASSPLSSHMAQGSFQGEGMGAAASPPTEEEQPCPRPQPRGATEVGLAPVAEPCPPSWEKPSPLPSGLSRLRWHGRFCL